MIFIFKFASYERLLVNIFDGSRCKRRTEQRTEGSDIAGRLRSCVIKSNYQESDEIRRRKASFLKKNDAL